MWRLSQDWHIEAGIECRIFALEAPFSIGGITVSNGEKYEAKNALRPNSIATTLETTVGTFYHSSDDELTLQKDHTYELRVRGKSANFRLYTDDCSDERFSISYRQCAIAGFQIAQNIFTQQMREHLERRAFPVVAYAVQNDLYGMLLHNNFVPELVMRHVAEINGPDYESSTRQKLSVELFKLISTYAKYREPYAISEDEHVAIFTHLLPHVLQTYDRLFYAQSCDGTSYSEQELLETSLELSLEDAAMNYADKLRNNITITYSIRPNQWDVLDGRKVIHSQQSNGPFTFDGVKYEFQQGKETSILRIISPRHMAVATVPSTLDRTKLSSAFDDNPMIWLPAAAAIYQSFILEGF